MKKWGKMGLEGKEEKEGVPCGDRVSKHLEVEKHKLPPRHENILA